MTPPKQVLLGFAIGYLVLFLGVATGATLPGDHTIEGFRPSLAFYAFGGSIEAAYNCSEKKVVVTAHDTQGSFRRTRRGTLVFKQGGNTLTTPWTFNAQDPSNDQVIATVATGSSTGTWSVSLQEDPGVATTVQIPSGACPSPSSGLRSGSTPGATARPTPTPAPGTGARPTPTPTPVCQSPTVYDNRLARCVQLGSNGLG